MKDGCDHPAIRRLASIGRHPDDQNCHLRLTKLIAESCGFGKLITPLAGFVNSAILPSQIFRRLHSSNRTAFKRVFGADPKVVEKFWSDFFASEGGLRFKDQRPELRGKTPSQLRTLLPITLHEDAGPYAKKKSVHEISWGPIMGGGSDWESRFVFATYMSVPGQNPTELAVAFQTFFADLDDLCKGHDQANVPFAIDDESRDCGGWGLCLLFGQTDLEQATVGWGMQSYGGADRICGFCRADRTGMAFSNLHADAGWRGAEMTESDFQLCCRRGHPVRESRYWCRSFPRLDVMHVMDHHGSTGILEGSVIQKLVKYSRGADSVQPCFPKGTIVTSKGTIVTSTIQWFRLVLFVF